MSEDNINPGMFYKNLDAVVDNAADVQSLVLGGGVGLFEGVRRSESMVGVAVYGGLGVAASYLLAKGEKTLFKKAASLVTKGKSEQTENAQASDLSRYAGKGLGFGAGAYMLYKYIEHRLG